MAIDANILLRGITPDLGRAIQQGLAIGENIRNAPILRELNQQKLDQGRQALAAGQQAAGQREAIAAYKAFQGEVTPDNYAQGVMTLSEMGFQFDPEEMEPTAQNIAQMQNMIDIGRQSMPQGDDKARIKILEESRGVARESKKTIDKEATLVSKNWDNINNLSNRIDAGDRQAVAPALISLVKIGQPDNAVLIGEMEAQLNAKDPIAAMADLLKGQAGTNEVAASISQKLDLLNPENINTDDLKGTARVLLRSGTKSVLSRFDELEDYTSTRLTDFGAKSIYTDKFRNRIRGLETLGLSSKEKGIYNWAIQNRNSQDPNVSDKANKALRKLGY